MCVKKLLKMKNNKLPVADLLQKTALVFLLTGGAVSFFMVLYSSRNTHSVLLKVLFSIWVLSPFVALFIINNSSAGWKLRGRITFYILIYLLTIFSVSGYGGILIFPRTKPAFIYIVVPFINWIFAALVIFFIYGSSRSTEKN